MNGRNPGRVCMMKILRYACLFMLVALMLCCQQMAVKAQELNGNQSGQVDLSALQTESTTRPDGEYDKNKKDSYYSEAAPSLQQDTAGNYLVGTVADLNTLRSDLSKHVDYTNKTVIMTADIDATGLEAYPVHRYLSDGDENTSDSKDYVYAFGGTFNGMGHKITHYSDGSSGLFDVLTGEAQVGNLTMEINQSLNGGLNASDSGASYNEYQIGIIANSAYGYITRCGVTGSVTEAYTGKKTTNYETGLVGIIGAGSYLGNSSQTLKIEDCYSTVNYTKTNAKVNMYVNALGFNTTRCYYAGTCTGLTSVDIPFYHSVWTVTDCYYDKDALGITSPTTGGTGLAAADMKKQASYANWDFSKVWTIAEGQSLPTLNTANTTLKKRMTVNLKVELEPLAIDYTKVSTKRPFPILTTNVKDIKITTDLGNNPYNLKVIYTADTGCADYVGVLSDTNAEGVARFANADSIQLSYDANEEVDYFLPSDLYDKPSATSSTCGVTAWGSLTLASNTGSLTDARKKELDTKVDSACEILLSDEKVLGTGALNPKQTYDTYAIFDLLRSHSTKADESFYDQYYTNVLVPKYKGTTESYDMITLARDVMLITAMGYDPRNVGGVDLVDALTDSSKVDANGMYMAQPTRALAYNCFDFTNNNGYDLSAYIHSLAKVTTDAQGNPISSDGNSVPDMWSMTVQPMFAFYGKTGYEDVTAKMDSQILPLFHQSLTYLGSFWGGFDVNLSSTTGNHWDIHNAWTNAQAQICLGMAGISPYDSRFVAGSRTMYDPIIDSIDFTAKTADAAITTGIGPEQIIRGVTAMKRVEKGETTIYDCRDVKGTAYVKNLIDALDTTNKTKVTEAWNAYQALDAAKQASMNESDVNKLKAAVEGSTTTVDVTALNAAITAAGKLSQSDYTQASWEAFSKALTAAKAIDQKTATQDAVDKATKALTDAQGALVKKTEGTVDVTALNAAITAAGKLSQSDYTQASWEAFSKALTAAKAIDQKTATQDAVDAAAKTLTDAQKALVAVNAPSISYRTDVEGLGWRSLTRDGLTNGTTGRCLQVKAIQAKVVNSDGDAFANLGVSYSVHMNNTGWQSEKADGVTAGVMGEGSQAEALRMNLTGSQKDSYSIYYRVHARDFGWMAWAKDGEIAGTTGYGFRIEAVQIVIVAKGQTPATTEPANTTSKAASQAENVDVSVHGQNYGWSQGLQRANQMATATAGTTGQGLRIEAVKLISSDPALQIHYQAHVQNKGWMASVSEGNVAGTTGQGLRIEALKIWATGASASNYSVQYRAHVQNAGWTDWVTAGSTMENAPVAGTTGQGLRIEALQVRIVEK